MNRDRRIPKTPPVGVRAQTAAPLDVAPFDTTSETWDDDITPLPAEPRGALAAVDRRVKSSGQAALSRVDQLRAEVAGDMRDLDRKIDTVSTKTAKIGETMAAVSAQLAILIADRAVDRQEASVVRVEAVRTNMEIRKSREITEIADASADRAMRRRVKMRLGLKILSGIGAVWGLVAAMILAGKC
jgi:hypothetical protein